MKTLSQPRRPMGLSLLGLLIVVSGFNLTASVGRSAWAQTTPSVEAGKLGPGTTWETPWYVIESGIDGPTVLVVGGIHGNEPAGSRAAEQIRHWPIARGKLIVLPKINRLGLKANMRWSPDYRNDRKRRDLNRGFPTDERDTPLTPHAQAVWEWITAHRPDWVFDLHEGFDVHRLNSESVGSSVIAFPDQFEFARALQQAVNADIEADRQFDLLAKSGPVRGSLARACREQLDAKSFILETTYTDQPVSRRTRQHRRMISTALQKIGVLRQDCVDVIAPAAPPNVTRVGIFDDSGANETKVLNVLEHRPELLVRLLGPRDMLPQVLAQFDVLVFPGGSGSKQGRAIGAQRRKHIRSFVNSGGGVLGICAGAYLCSSHYDWSLDLMNAAVFNQSFEIPGKGRKSMWYRGPGTSVDVEATPEGSQELGLYGVSSIRYQNGPILSPGNDPTLPAYQTWAVFRSENGIYEPQKDTMIGAPAIVAATYGEGRVIAISPHFESTPGHESLIGQAIKYLSIGTLQNADRVLSSTR